MSDTVTISGSISVKRDSTAQTLGIALTSVSVNLAATPELDGSQKTLSTSFQSLDFDEVGMNEITWVMLINHSATDAEIITIAKLAEMAGDVTDDGSVAGASLAATLTGAGYYKTITTDGTSNGTDWKVGDRAVYLGSSGVYARVPASALIVIPAGYTAGPIKLNADNLGLYAKSASGTPQLGWVVAGALA
jgi:hypothetical protein